MSSCRCGFDVFAILLLSLAVAGGPAPLSSTSAAAVAAPAAPSREAVALLDAMRPRQPAIDAEIAIFDSGAPALFADEESKALEADHPGLTDKIVQATRAVLVAHAAVSEDRLRPRLAAILDSGLTPVQLIELTEFYQSSAGLAIIEQMQGAAGRMNTKDFVEAVRSDKVKASHLEGIRTQAANAVRLTGLQQAAVQRFLESPSGQALNKLQPKLVKVQVDFANEPDPAFDAAMEAATAKIMNEMLGAGE